MRILLIANYVADSQQSMQRFAAMLEHGLRQAGDDVQVIRPSAIAGKLPCRGVAAKWLGYVDKFVFFPRMVRRAALWADVIHICDHSNSFYVRHLGGRDHVITCHDLFAIRSALGAIPQQHTGWTGRLLQRMILDGLKTAKHIVCVSDATRLDLLEVAGITESTSTRIYNGMNYPFSPMERTTAEARLHRLGIPDDRPFILHVGGNQWYKNRLGVLEIFSRLSQRPEARGVRLVMVGKPWTVAMRRLAQERHLGPTVHELAGIGEEDLRALYSRAALLLFPSLGEGFGWPVAEAQACGCPVVTSNRAPMTEVGGNAARYIDPEDYESAMAAIIEVLQSPGDLPEKGLRNVARFSTSQAIQSYLKVYGKVRGGAEPAFAPEGLDTSPRVPSAV